MAALRVAVAGPNGTVGAAAIRHLLKAGFAVTALTRNVEKTKTAFPKVEAIETDYRTVDKLTGTLRSCGKLDAVVCLIWRKEVQAQINLIDATIAAGVPHYIPSSFGADMTLPANRDNPALVEKRQMEDHLKNKADAGLINFTAINIGMFLDWALENEVLLNVKGNDPVRLFNGGNVEISTTLRDDAGKAITNALLKAKELRNRFCYIHSALVTQRQLLGYAKELVPDRKLEEVNIDTLEMRTKSQESYDKGDHSVPTMRGFIMHGVYSGTGTFRKTDNALLGIEELTKPQLKDLIAKIAL